MTTHYLLSDSNEELIGYSFSDISSEKLITFEPNTQIIVLEEYLGNSCNFHKIIFNENEYFVLNDYIKPLQNTADSAPFICIRNVPNYSYVEPDWNTLPVEKPYFNEKTLEYSIPVVVNSINLSNLESLKQTYKKIGLKLLLEYYNKISDEDTLNKLLNYYIFANIKDIYVPYRPLQRIKMLVTVQKKYFDAVEQDIVKENQSVYESDNANYIISFDTSYIKTIFKSVERNLKNYNDDVYLSNSKIQIKLGTEDNGFFNTSKQLREELSLVEKSEKINIFFNSLSNLLLDNGFDINSPNQIIELAIDDKCNIIYDISIFNNSNCKKLRIGIKKFLKTDPINDPTIVALVKNAERISKLEKCKVPWPEFVETYIYPETIVRNISINDIIQNFEKNKYEYAKDLFQIVNSFQELQNLNPAKSYKDVFDEELQIAKVKESTIWDLFLNNQDNGPLYRMLYKGDNFFDRSNIDKTLANLDMSVSQLPNQKKKTFAFSSVTQTYKVVEPKMDQENGEIYVFSSKDNEQRQKNELILFDNVNPKKLLDTNNGLQSLPIWILKKQPSYSKTGERFFFIRLYEILNKVGLCTIIDFTNNCVLSLAREFITAEVNATVAIGQITSLSSKEIKEDVIPYLPKEQQEFVYNELLNKISCLNSFALLYILKRTLPEQQYLQLGLDNASYENIVLEISKLMSTSPQ